MYRRFGSRVTVIERADRLIPREDEDISRAVREILEGEGIEIRLEAECIGLEPRDEGVSVSISCTPALPEVVASHVLLATGRRPNTDDAGLAQAGVRTDQRGFIVVDDHLRTNVPSIWAVGECNGRGGFTHTAYHDHQIVASHLLEAEPRRLQDRIPCYALFTDPPLGRVGLTEGQARASGRKVLVARRAMTRVGRARERGETQGFMQVLVDAESYRFLGASILGINGDEAIHCILDAMYLDAPYTALQRAVHIHPTVSELIPTLLEDLKPLDG